MTTMVRSTMGLSADAALALAQDIFARYDTDRTGTLEAAEFEVVCRNDPRFLEAFLHS